MIGCAPGLALMKRHEIIIYVMRLRTRAGNLTGCYREKQIDVSFKSAIAPWIHSYFNNVMKFIVNNRTDAWKADVNLLNGPQRVSHWSKGLFVMGKKDSIIV